MQEGVCSACASCALELVALESSEDRPALMNSRRMQHVWAALNAEPACVYVLDSGGLKLCLEGLCLPLALC